MNLNDNVMIDLETLGQGAGAVVLTIGAVGLNLKGETVSFSQAINLHDSIEKGFRVEASTLLWWLRQSDAARAEIADCENGMSVLSSITRFRCWLQDNFSENVVVWSNGASFDLPILAELYRKFELTPPWKFWNGLCFRTIKALHPEIKMEKKLTAHSALQDAKMQWEHLLKICEG